MNRYDLVIWLAGLWGRFLVFRKYITIALRTPALEILFDFCILINIILLSLDGIIIDSTINQVDRITTFVLIIELTMKMISISISMY